MKELPLKDILLFNEEEKNRAMIALNMSWGGKSHFERWNESPADNRDVSYSYASRHGARVRKITKMGQLVFGFVQLSGNYKRRLLVTIGKNAIL